MAAPGNKDETEALVAINRFLDNQGLTPLDTTKIFDRHVGSPTISCSRSRKTGRITWTGASINGEEMLPQILRIIAGKTDADPIPGL